MSSDRLRVQSDERVDIEDFRFLAGEGTQASLRQIGKDFFTSGGGVKHILDGFDMSNPAAKQLQVDRGTALLSQRLAGAVVDGIVTSEGETSRIIDLNAYAPGDYGIYIRFEEIAGDQEGRIFWNPTGLGSEYTATIPTRWQANWGLRVESGSPGAEWFQIGEVAQATMAITDQRDFFFEGSVDSTYASGWSAGGGGTSDDRRDDRAEFGVKDLQTFTRAMRQCIEDVKGRGLRRWYKKGIGGMNVGFDDDPVEDRVAIGDANFHMLLSGTDAILNFDTTDLMTYDRTANTLTTSFGGSDKYVLGAASWSPVADDDVNLGTITEGWSRVYGNAGVFNASAATGTNIIGVSGVAKGNSPGIQGLGGTSGRGGYFLAGGGNTAGVLGVSTGSGAGVSGTGGSTGAGVYGTSVEGIGLGALGGTAAGGTGNTGTNSLGGPGVGTDKDGGYGGTFTGGAPTGTGVSGIGATGTGAAAVNGAGGIGFSGQGGAGGVAGNGGYGVQGVGGAPAGAGVGGYGGHFTGTGTGGAVGVYGSATSGYGGWFRGDTANPPAYAAVHIVPQAAAPTVLTDGDMWITGNHIYVRLGGASVQID